MKLQKNVNDTLTNVIKYRNKIAFEKSLEIVTVKYDQYDNCIIKCDCTHTSTRWFKQIHRAERYKKSKLKINSY